MLFSKSALSSESRTIKWYFVPEALSRKLWALTSGRSIPIRKVGTRKVAYSMPAGCQLQLSSSMTTHVPAASGPQDHKRQDASHCFV